MVKIILIIGAKGGAGRSTACVRLAESFAASAIPAGIIDLSEYPTAHWIVRNPAVIVAPGKGASSTSAARALLKPLESKCDVILVDTGRLNAAALNPWVEIADTFIVLSRFDPLSVKALPAIWASIDAFRKMNPTLKFAGFLPMMTTQESAKLADEAARRFPGTFLPFRIPFDRSEADRNHARCFEGTTDVAVPARELQPIWSALSKHLGESLYLKPRVAEEPKEGVVRGVLGKIWKLAASKIATKVKVVTT